MMLDWINWSSPVTWVLIAIVGPMLVTLVVGILHAVIMGPLMAIGWVIWQLLGKRVERDRREEDYFGDG